MDAHAQLTDLQFLRQPQVRPAVHPVRPLPLAPHDYVIKTTQAPTLSEVRGALLVDPGHHIDPALPPQRQVEPTAVVPIRHDHTPRLDATGDLP
jgi:hypothetical protein